MYINQLFKRGLPHYLILISTLITGTPLVHAGATHVEGGTVGIDIISPAHQERLSALPAVVKIDFNVSIDPDSLNIRLNGKRITDQFNVSGNGAEGALSMQDGLRPRLGKEGQLFAPNILQVQAREQGTGKPLQATRHFFLNAQATSPKAVATITPQGGSVVLPGYGSVTFPAGAFAQDQVVELAVTSDPLTAQDFETTSVMFSAGIRLPYEFRVNTGAAQPATDFNVTFEVPDSFRTQVPVDSEVRVFAQFFEDGGEEILDSFELSLPRFTAADRTVSVSLPAQAFTHRRNIKETYEAIIVLGTTPTK